MCAVDKTTSIEVNPLECSKDFYYMELALQEAKKAFDLGEVPVGALLVYDREIIAREHNLVETLSDATAHAEMLCIKKAGSRLQNWRLNRAVLYTTLEPCAMCMGALLLSRVDKVVWGAPDIRQGAGGSWVDLVRIKHPIHRMEVQEGVLKEPCAQLMTQFFRQRRKSL